MNYLVSLLPAPSLLVTLFLLLGSSSLNAQELLIENINVIDVENGELTEKVDVYIRSHTIHSIVRAGSENAYPEDITVIDGTGKFLSPGFIDAHTHFAIGTAGFEIVEGIPKLEMNILDEVPRYSLPLMMAFGITTTRDPGGKTEVTTTLKKEIQNGTLTGPELFVAGSIIDTTSFENLVATVKSEEDIRNEVRNQYRAGVDYIKLYTSLNPDQIEAGIDEAHKLGLETIAHLENTSWTEAAERELDNIVHIIPGSERLLPRKHRNEFTSSMLGGTQWFYKWFEFVDLDGPEIKEMIHAMKQHNVSVDPTLVLFHSVFFANENIYQENPALEFVPQSMVENWSTFNFNLGWSEEDYQRAKQAWDKVEKFTKLLHESGIMLTAGTDANNPWIPAGESFHRELELLASSGISNGDVLTMATLNGAKLLGIEDRTGSIREGKEADLVVLSKNPLEKIANTRHIDVVIMDGKVFNPSEQKDKITK
jgi:imidazolonepropionase-like amidohydrolase